MDAIQNFVDKNHRLLVSFGAIIAFVLLAIYFPIKVHNDAQEQIAYLQSVNVSLNEQIEHISKQVNYLTMSNKKRQALEKEVMCLAKNIYFEAGLESKTGKIAVAEVTMNRVKHHHFPKSVCKVVYQKLGRTCMFSWVCIRKNHSVPQNRMWNESLAIAESILISGKRYGIIGDAKFFHGDYIEPNKDFQRLTRVTQIGRHIFYK